MRVEALVIGAGPGGYVAGIRLAQLGKKTLVIEKEKAGGVCLNVGCIPSKALINASKLHHKLLHASEMGIMADNIRVDMPALQAWKGQVVEKLTGGVKSLLKSNGAEFKLGTAKLVSANKVAVDGPEGAFEVEADNIILATGSRPVEIPGFAFDGNRIIDSTGALALQEVPKRLVVIGGGYIGMEMGTLYHRLGAQVTMVEALPSILGGTDKDLAAVVARKAKKMGMEVLTGAKAQGWEEAGDHAKVTLDVGGEARVVEADKVLVAVGRRPNTQGLGLEELGVKMERGMIQVNTRQQTNVPGLYAIGDITGNPMLAHKGSKEGEVAAEVIAGKPAEMDVRTIPAVIFTDPEVASAGLTEAAAKEKGLAVKVGKFPFAALGKAIANSETDGFVKVLVDKSSSEILGIHVVGNGASDMIGEAALAIEMGALADDLGLTVHAHPTLPEALMEAAKASQGEAVHIQNR